MTNRLSKAANLSKARNCSTRLTKRAIITKRKPKFITIKRSPALVLFLNYVIGTPIGTPEQSELPEAFEGQSELTDASEGQLAKPEAFDGQSMSSIDEQNPAAEPSAPQEDPQEEDYEIANLRPPVQNEGTGNYPGANEEQNEGTIGTRHVPGASEAQNEDTVVTGSNVQGVT